MPTTHALETVVVTLDLLRHQHPALLEEVFAVLIGVSLEVVWKAIYRRIVKERILAEDRLRATVLLEAASCLEGAGLAMFCFALFCSLTMVYAAVIQVYVHFPSQVLHY